MFRSAKHLVLIASAAGLLVGCQGGSSPNIELIQDMMDSPAVKAQEAGMRVPPEGTVPVGFKPYKYATNPEAAYKENKNPIAGQKGEEVLAKGMKMYDTHCAVCHGPKGEGAVAANLSIAEFMPLKPPSLLSDKVRAMSDGQLYHIITMGQGVMGPYATHVPQSVRWELVNYIRFLESQAK